VITSTKPLKVAAALFTIYRPLFDAGLETEFTRPLRERMEAGQRCVAEARARGEYQAPESGLLFEARRRRLLEAVGFK
jgi:hypothetical protein